MTIRSFVQPGIWVLYGIFFGISADAKALSYKQEKALERIWAWIVDPEKGNGRRVPTPSEITGVVQIDFNLLIGQGYGASKPIFANPEDFYLALKDFLEIRNMHYSLLKIKVLNGSQEFLERVREDVNYAVLRWIMKHSGSFPSQADFGIEPEQIPVAYSRVTSTGKYARGQSAERWGLYPDAPSFWRQFVTYAKRRGFPLRLIHKRLKAEEYSEELKIILQQEALEMIAEWIRDNRRIPEARNFCLKTGQIHMDYGRLTGTRYYAPGKPDHRFAIFPSAQALWRAYKAYSEEELKIPFRLIDIRMVEPLEAETREILRREVSEDTWRWMNETSSTLRFPRKRFFDTKANKISNVRYRKLVAEDPLNMDFALFESWVEFLRYLKMDPHLGETRFRLLDLDEAYHDETRPLIQEEAIDELAQWLEKNLMLFALDELTLETLQNLAFLPIGFDKLTGTGHYRDRPKGRYHLRVFDSPEAAWFAFQTRLRLKVTRTQTEYACKRVLVEAE